MNLPKHEIQALRDLRKAKVKLAKTAPMTIRGNVSWTNGMMAGPARYFGDKRMITHDYDHMAHQAVMSASIKTRINNGRKMVSGS